MVAEASKISPSPLNYLNFKERFAVNEFTRPVSTVAEDALSAIPRGSLFVCDRSNQPVWLYSVTLAATTDSPNRHHLADVQTPLRIEHLRS